jgi:hypothetical protein
MSIASLPTLAEISATRRAVPKHELATRLQTKTVADRDDARLLREVAQAVRVRDGGRCRHCKVRTLVTMELVARRGECHHVVSRTCLAVRYDVRNCLHVCAGCHSLLTARRLFVVGRGSHMFQAGKAQKSYVDTTFPVEFAKKHP